MNETNAKAESIASDILTLSRNSLLVNFRFLDRAISRLEFVSDDNFFMASDGEHLFYDPWYVLSQYKSESSTVTRNMFHALLHCIYCHSYIGKDMNRARWDLACDIAVENTINDMKSPVLHSSRESLQTATVSLLKDEIGTLTAERIYRYLKDKNIPDDELTAEREKFIGDGHGLWYGENDPNAKQDRNIQLKKIWEEVSKRIQTELETMNKDASAALVQNLRMLNRQKKDYSDYLRKFGVHGEVMKLSDEEFDNNYYTYGLSLYGNVPLVEPLEYSERKLIREFVIAIDTSGSVKGEIVQNFIQHTHDILMQRESFFERINLHIIMCDYKIREDAVIKSREDFENYIKTMEIKGLEKTDFRPVFEYVDRFIETKEIDDLQGLIYFTDGRGTFPVKKPSYDVAFIIKETDYSTPDIPVWAQYLTITEDEILERRF